MPTELDKIKRRRNRRGSHNWKRPINIHRAIPFVDDRPFRIGVCHYQGARCGVGNVVMTARDVIDAVASTAGSSAFQTDKLCKQAR